MPRRPVDRVVAGRRGMRVHVVEEDRGARLGRRATRSVRGRHPIRLLLVNAHDERACWRRAYGAVRLEDRRFMGRMQEAFRVGHAALVRRLLLRSSRHHAGPRGRRRVHRPEVCVCGRKCVPPDPMG